MDDETTVRVAVRIRPQLPREKIEQYRVCTCVTPGEPQITLGSDKAFTYDYVFDMESTQNDIYATCAEALVMGSLQGYNATVLAYGQTGSGKTYTMGTGFDLNLPNDKKGIIPRAIDQIFDGIQRLTDAAVESNQTPPQFKISAQFLELYNDEVIDLFDANVDYMLGKGKSNVRIHEDANKNVYVTGVTSERVDCAEDAMRLLKQGALARTTASTQMNAQSSRSHAIFTLHIKQQRLVKLELDEEETDGTEEKGQEFETLSAKFHFVDLAGSERLKRTGATGDRAKEGIAINCGLLALGNVISALGDLSKKALHVPYRDSKLTRLLRDSLGGNSRTLMIACVSPSDRDFMETLNTLKYANRARNIQNKVVLNQDKSSRTIALLKKEIQDLKLELLDYKQGKKMLNEDGTEIVNDMFHENTLLQSENDNLKTRVKAMQETIDSLSAKLANLMAEKATSASWINGNSADGSELKEMVKGYLTEMETLRAQLVESESICAQLRKQLSRKPMLSPTRHDGFSDPSIDGLIDLAKRDLEKDLEAVARSQVNENSDQSDSGSESETTEENEGVSAAYSNELASLNSEISLKQRLIEELEKNQRKLANMKIHYEDKLNQLEAKIAATQLERDQVLASYSDTKQPSDKVKKIKDEYEKKIQNMQREMKGLQAAKKEHAKLLRDQNQYQMQLRTLNNEVSDMKRTKVKLMNKMKEEAQKHKSEQLQNNRKIAQLLKKSRQDANLIRNLDAENRIKSAVLKRKQEEVSHLKRASNNRVRPLRTVNNNIAKQVKSSPKAAKQKWTKLERMIQQNTALWESQTSLEKQMERMLSKRAEVLEEVKMKESLLEDERFGNSSVIKEELDSLEASLDHVQSSIRDLQSEILQVEENMTQLEIGELLEGVSSLQDASYITDKLYNLLLHTCMLKAKTDEQLRTTQAKLEILERDSKTQSDLLEHVIMKNNHLEPSGRTSPVNFLDNNASSRIPKLALPTDNIITAPRPRKKLTMTPDEFLFGTQNTGSVTTLPSPEIMPPPPLTRSFTTVKVASVPSSPALVRKGALTLSPRTNRKPLSNHPSMERLDKSPPGSPPVYRRQTSRDENVFSRLTQQQMNNSNRHPGKITAHIPKKIGKTPLICTHTAEGHSRAVLALCATEDLLFSASQDRHVIQWDLNEMREVNVFGNHPNNVVCVKYDSARRIMYSVSNSFIKIWDTRDNKCIKTLTSSGLTANFSSSNFNTSEPQINDIALNTRNLVLYSAAGDKVRIWDLRKFGVVGKLTGGHQAAIMCISTTKGPNHSDVVFTGSKDHYIKVFDVPLGTIAGTLTPRVTLEPPHYDGIQCLVNCGSTLFSGSRDCIIKKWTNDELVTSVNLAHKDWVTGLCLFQGSTVLASSCRDGTVKLWSTDTCNLLGEIKAHSSPINTITSNSNFLFTASSKEVRLWRHQPPQDIMSMSTGHMFQLSV